MTSIKSILLLGGVLVLAALPLKAEEVAFLGNGYTSSTNTLLAPCLVISKDNIRYTGAQTSTLSFSKTASLDDLLMDLGLKFSGQLSLEGLSLSGAQQYAITMAEDSYSDSVVVTYKVRGKTASFDNAKIDPAVIALKNTLNPIDKKDEYEKAMKERCGDKFVSSVELGADLNIGFKVTYINKEFKSKFAAEIKADILGMINGSGSATAIVDKYSNKAMITISAFQRGGDTAALANILTAKGDETKPNDDRIYHIYKCGLSSLKSDEVVRKPGVDPVGNPGSTTTETEFPTQKLANDHCRIALDGMLTYMRTDFPNQIKNLEYDVFLNGSIYKDITNENTSAEKDAPGAAILGAQYISYKQGGYAHLFSAANPGLTRELQQKRDKILTAYKKIQFFVNRIESYSNFDHLSDKDKESLDEKREVFNKALIETKDAGTYCFKFNPDEQFAKENEELKKLCHDSFSKFDKTYNSIRDVLLNPDSLKVNQNFYHYCRMRKDADQETTCRTIRRVAISLSKLQINSTEAKEFCAPGLIEGADIDDCSDLYEQVSKQQKLVLSFDPKDNSAKALYDLSPLANIKFKELDLSGNQIADLTPIVIAGSELDSLNLSGNKIDNLAFFQKFKKLRGLNVANNKIESFACEGGDQDKECNSWRAVLAIDVSGNPFYEMGSDVKKNLDFLSQKNKFKNITFGKINCSYETGKNNCALSTDKGLR